MMSAANTLGSSVDELTTIIAKRSAADLAESYTAKLLHGDLDYLLKKIGEEATEVVMAAKDTEGGSGNEQLRYEAVDLLYHLLVACERLGVSPEDLAAEIKGRF
ncbi:MAG: phosphoribosyl-ATP diphosphatase [Coriobacteriia bacterium]|nr:phosphoribosyl-ATP diphosphatase [Coriobacteriia bacterium]MCL2871142.1 phosphoribosyl-ATP diphosphatase [Coriobacteriia bacterium]